MESLLIRVEALDESSQYPIILLEKPFDNQPIELIRDHLPSPLPTHFLNQPLTPGEMKQFVLDNKDYSDDFLAIGKTLFTWLAQTKVYEKWQERCDEIKLRTLLEIVPNELSQIPWELLCRDKGLPEPLFMKLPYPFARFHSYKNSPSTSATWPVRVLVVVGSKSNDPNVQAEAELEAIQRELISFGHSVDLEILNRPTHDELLTTLQDFLPHVFHFIGHGVEDPETRSGTLRFERDQEPWTWIVEDIALDVESVSWQPRFVFLNACRTREAEAATRAVTKAFIAAGVPAVLGMQADIRADLAGLFATEVYKGITEGKDMDIIVASARNKVRVNVREGLRTRDWALPSLSLSLDPGRVFPIPPKIGVEQMNRITLCPIFQKCRQFTNRRSERRSIFQGFHPILPDREANHLLILTGAEKIGKSALIHWCLEKCALQNHIVRYIEISDQGSGKSSLDLIRIIRDGDPSKAQSSLLHEPLPLEQFYRFNWELNHLLQRGAVKDWDGSQTQDERLPLTDVGGDLPRQILEAFCLALEQAAGENELVLVLDHFGSSIPPETTFKNELLPYFVTPIALKKLPHVKLVLVLNSTEEKEFDRYGLEQLESESSRITLKTLEPSLFKPLAREFFWYLDLPGLNELIDLFISQKIQERWAPNQLDTLKQMADLMFKEEKHYSQRVGRMR